MLHSLSSSRLNKSRQKDLEMEVLDNTKEGLYVAERGLEIKLGRLFEEQALEIDRILREIKTN